MSAGADPRAKPQFGSRADPRASTRQPRRGVPRASPLARAEEAIAREGALLVYPIANRREPRSLWHVLYPRSEMRWAWDEGADMRVVKLWQLREQLASRREVVYSKWFKGRAVFFSQPVFGAMLAVSRSLPCALSPDARDLLALLEEDSPQSTKQLRRAAGLTGRQSERTWTNALRELWERLLIVGTGEVDDGAFPSLAIGATRWIFEGLWEQAGAGPSPQQARLIARVLSPATSFGRHWQRVLAASERGVSATAERDAEPPDQSLLRGAS